MGFTFSKILKKSPDEVNDKKIVNQYQNIKMVRKLTISNQQIVPKLLQFKYSDQRKLVYVTFINHSDFLFGLFDLNTSKTLKRIHLESDLSEYGALLPPMTLMSNYKLVVSINKQLNIFNLFNGKIENCLSHPHICQDIVEIAPMICAFKNVNADITIYDIKQNMENGNSNGLINTNISFYSIKSTKDIYLITPMTDQNFAAASSGYVYVYDLATHDVICKSPYIASIVENTIINIACSQDKEILIYSTGLQLIVWNWRKTAVPYILYTDMLLITRVVSYKNIIVGILSTENILKIFNLKSKKLLWKSRIYDEQMENEIMFADGTILCSGSAPYVRLFAPIINNS